MVLLEMVVHYKKDKDVSVKQKNREDNAKAKSYQL